MKKLQLKPYQEDAKKWVLNHKRTFLFMEAGTGKTAVVIKALRDAYLKGEVKRAFIFIPASLYYSWKIEVAKFMDLAPHQYVMTDMEGTKKQREEKYGRLIKIPNRLQIIITNYEKADIMLKEFQKFDPDFVALDESQMLKNRNAKRTKGVKKVCKKATYVIGMSGTPAPQGYQDYFSQFEIVDPKVFGEKITDFRDRYLILDYFGGVKRYLREEELLKKVRDNSFRIKLNDVAELLGMTNQDIVVPMSTKTKKYYKTMNEDYKLNLDNVVYSRKELKQIHRDNGLYYHPRESYSALLMSASEGIELKESTSNIALTCMLRLQQLTSGFTKLDTGKEVNITDDKINVCVNILKERKVKTLIFCRFKRDIHNLKNRLRIEGLSVGVYNKNDDSEDRWHNGDFDVFLLNIASGGTGLNLQEASRVIFFSLHPNAGFYTQAIARAYRTGQKSHVQVFNLLMDESIDLDIKEYIQRKIELSERMFKNVTKRIRK